MVTHAVSDEPEEEGPDWHSQGDHQGPNTHVTGTILLEGRLHHDRTTNGRRRRNEESNQSSTSSDRCVGRALRATHITYETADEGEKEDGTTAETVGQWLPEQRCTSQNGDLQRGQVAGLLQAHS